MTVNILKTVRLAGFPGWVLLCLGACTAQDTLPVTFSLPAWAFKTNPLATVQGQVPGAGEIQAIGELPLGSRESVQLAGAFSYLTPLGRTFYESMLEEGLQSQGIAPVSVQILWGRGVRIQGGYRWYWNSPVLKGWYLTTLLNLHWFWMYTEIQPSLGPFLLRFRYQNWIAGLGFQTFSYRSGILLDLTAGFNYRMIWVRIRHLPSGNAVEDRLDGVSPYWVWFTFAIGWVNFREIPVLKAGRTLP